MPPKGKKRGLVFGRFIRDHFIPHKGNDYVPHMLKHRALFGYGAFMIALKAAAILAPLFFSTATVYSSAITPKSITELTNRARQAAGLKALSLNAKLTAAAQQKADDMLRRQYFSHVSPSGQAPWYWIKRSGYVYRVAGENLAVHFEQAEDTQAGWMASPTHRSNILDARYKDIGIGVAQGIFEDKPSFIVVQMFAMPRLGSAQAQAKERIDSDEAAMRVNAFHYAVSPQELYALDPDALETSRVAGFVVSDFTSGVSQFYFYAMLGLAAALLLKIFVKVRIQRYPVIAHTLGVIVMAFTFWAT